EVELLRGLEAEHLLDHRVEDVAREVEGALELGREVALVHLAVALDLGAVLSVEIDRGDALGAHAGDDLAAAVRVRARAGPEHEAENEDRDHEKQRPLQLVEAVAHRLEHRKTPPPVVRERATIAGRRGAGQSWKDRPEARSGTADTDVSSASVL